METRGDTVEDAAMAAGGSIAALGGSVAAGGRGPSLGWPKLASDLRSPTCTST